MNLHMQVTEREYDALLREARKQGLNPTVQSYGESPLFASFEVKLYVNPNADSRNYKYLTINDPTYSRTITRIEERI